MLFCHSGLDPESNSYSLSYATGCRIKSGMTGRKKRILNGNFNLVRKT
jgi:hypothetical protein